jgi:signal transduction histidine kinase/DNA-binding LacI/PurR family transcriptional regulator
MTSKPPSSSRKTIGVLAARLERVWGSEFMSGLTDAANTSNVNLICFVGGKPNPIITPGNLQPSYGLYDLVKHDQLDGLILCADLAHGLKTGELRQFCRNFVGIPTVTHAIDLEEAPNLLADNLNGMRAAIRHLIEVHKCQHIAFIRGPRDQTEAEQRFQAYQEELLLHNIRYDERLVVQGDYSLESGRAATQTLLEQRKTRIDAIAASNDRMAFGALEVLQTRGIQVPGEIALTGFDDVAEAQSLGVPLTTVHQDFYEIGRQALLTLLRVIEGESLSGRLIQPSSLVVRWSCGCLPESIRNAVVGPQEVARTGQLANKREAAIQALLQSAGIAQDHPAVQELRQAIGATWDAFLAALRGERNGDTFLKAVEALIGLLQQNHCEASVWHNEISILRRHALAGINDTELALHAENLFQQARMLVGELSQRAQAYRRLVLERQEEILQGLSFSMAPAMSLNEIGQAIAQHFPVIGIPRWYVMFYSDVVSPESVLSAPSRNYRLLLRYDKNGFQIPSDQPNLVTGQLIPRGELPSEQRYTAIVMPLTLARNRFGFMWVEMGPDDWEVYARIRNLVSSALLRTMLVEQREQAQREVEHLYAEVQQRADELVAAKERAEQAAIENARLYQAEQGRRQQAEALAKAARQISSLLKVEDVTRQILEQLQTVIPYDRGGVLLEQPNGEITVVAQRGFPENISTEDLLRQVNFGDAYAKITSNGDPLILDDVTELKGWKQTDKLPPLGSWLGIPLFAKDKVTGMLSLTRAEPNAFSPDDRLLAATFATQAAIALENARLYEEVTQFNEMMERMVEQRVNELSQAYDTLAKLDQNKASFIRMAAHELRTPLTVMKGYVGMLRGHPAVQGNPELVQAIDGVLTGTDRLHSVVNSMLDVARLESEVLKPVAEPSQLALILRLIQKDYAEALTERNLTLVLDEEINNLPLLMVDSEMIQKALDHVIVNAIKYTPDGGTITVRASVVTDERMEKCAEIQVQDTGIGIDPANHKIIFEKLYSLGKVELHSSGRTKFKGGGPGLGLAIAAGIIKAHGGKIWAESPGYDEEKCPGSTFFIRLPLAKSQSKAPR